MGDDDGGGIGDIFSDVVGAAGDELKKFGSSATSQVTGSKGSGQVSSSLDDTSVLTQFKKFGQSVTSQVTGSQPADANSASSGGKHADYDYSVLGELKKLGQSATSQVSGHDVSEMVKTDDAFSKKESAVVAAKIKQIYAEYAAKKSREEKQEELVEKQKEEMKEEQTKEIKNEETSAAIQKTRAEIKNYGAE